MEAACLRLEAQQQEVTHSRNSDLESNERFRPPQDPLYPAIGEERGKLLDKLPDLCSAQ